MNYSQDGVIFVYFLLQYFDNLDAGDYAYEGMVEYIFDEMKVMTKIRCQ